MKLSEFKKYITEIEREMFLHAKMTTEIGHVPPDPDVFRVGYFR